MGGGKVFKMDLGQNSPPHLIEKTLVERDLGIMIADDLKLNGFTK